MLNNKKVITKSGDVEGSEKRFFVAKKRDQSQLCGWLQILVETRYEINTYTEFTNMRWYREKYSDAEMIDIGISYKGAKNFE
jgi:hypothetical protein